MKDVCLFYHQRKHMKRHTCPGDAGVTADGSLKMGFFSTGLENLIYLLRFLL
jgi:hypothetical protein